MRQVTTVFTEVVLYQDNIEIYFVSAIIFHKAGTGTPEPIQ